MRRLKGRTLFLGMTLVAAFMARPSTPVVIAQEGGPSAASEADFKPVPLPDPGIPGFVFPEKEATILGWVQHKNHAAIDRHVWGIWTALTAPSGVKFEGQELRVFETWDTPGDLLDAAASARGRREPSVTRGRSRLSGSSATAA